MKINIKKLTITGIVAAMYVAITIMLSGLSYGGIQFRIAEALMLLCFYRKEYCYALSIGCFISNMFSPMPIDMVVGTSATILAAISIYLIGKSKINKTAALVLASFMPVIFNGVIVGLELGFLYGEVATYIYMLQVAFGEFVCVTILGVILFKAFEKNKHFMNLICFGDQQDKGLI